MTKINQQKFISYEEVRQGGETNMFDVKRVIELSDDFLTREDCLDIMKNYTKYEKKFGVKGRLNA